MDGTLAENREKYPENRYSIFIGGEGEGLAKIKTKDGALQKKYYYHTVVPYVERFG